MRVRLLFLLVCALIWPGLAHAWTDAHVREAHAAVELELPQQRVAVTLDVAVEVRGGWLERLDFTGLDDALTPLDEEPVYALLEGGERIPGKLSLRAGQVSARFQRRDGLRRGVHHVVLRYTAPLAQLVSRADGSARVAWTLPGWESGLQRGVIEIGGAPVLAPVQDSELAQQVERSEQAGALRLRFVRVLVPRASPWTVAVDVPAHVLAQSVVKAAPAQPLRAASGPRARTGAILALALLLLVLLRRARTTRPGAPYLGLWSALALAALGALCWTRALPLALLSWSLLGVLAGLQRPLAVAALPLGRVVPLDARALAELTQRARWERLGLPLGDVASWLGAASALALVAVVAVVDGALAVGGDAWGLGALCALFGAIACSRLWGPRSVAEQTRLLRHAAGRARLLGCALSLCGYVAERRVLHPRLRLVPSARYPGLLRLEVLVNARRGEAALWLSAVVEADSAAERWLAGLGPECRVERSAGGQRVALRWPIDDVGHAAEQLLARLGRESQRCLAEPAPASAA